MRGEEGTHPRSNAFLGRCEADELGDCALLGCCTLGWWHGETRKKLEGN